MIPKIIHYCWFGKNLKPESVKRCINSWKTHLPDYQIIEWNEDNFDVNSTPFVRQAYESKKYAFVADVVRFYGLQQFGGIYLDTDTEFIRFLPESFLQEKAFACFEITNFISLGLIGSHKNGKFVSEILNIYKDKNFIENNIPNLEDTTPRIATKFLKINGYKMSGSYEKKELITIYEYDYFNAKDFKTNLCEITDNTVCIHHYDATWTDYKQKILSFYKNRLIRSVSECKEVISDRAIIGLLFRQLGIRNIFDLIRKYL